MTTSRRALIAAFAALGLSSSFASPLAASVAPIPVIFHTDIGGDVDDTWALLYLLRCPQLDLKLVVTEGANAGYRMRLVAKLLALAGRSDVVIAGYDDGHDDRGNQRDRIGAFALKDYAGRVTGDVLPAMIDLIEASAQPVTIITVGPATTLADALNLRPAMARKARFVGMFGSVRTGYGWGKPPEAEYNVKIDPRALRTAFAADWLSCAITPLDTCGFFVLDGADMHAVRASSDPFARACIANSEVWLPNAFWMPKDFDLSKTSSTLFDVVAVQMAFDDSDLVMEDLLLSVTDEGMTVIDAAKGHPVRVAAAWRDMASARTKLVRALTGQPA